MIVPIYKTDEERTAVTAAADRLRQELAAGGVRVHLDGRDGMKPGAKYYEWEGRGVPLRLEIGPRDVAAGTVMLARRTGGKKQPIPMAGIAARLRQDRWIAMQQRPARGRAQLGGRQHSIRGATKATVSRLTWRAMGASCTAAAVGDPACEAEIKEQTKATIRVLAGRGVPLARCADDLHVVRPAERCRGGVGESVLTTTVSERPGGRSVCAS